MSKKLLLINPPHPFEERYGKGMDGVAPLLPSLGLLYIASAAESVGVDVSIQDSELYQHSIEETVSMALATNPDMIGITCKTSNIHRVIAICDGIKERSSIPVVLGGPHITVHKENVLRDNSVDYVIYGEGEETIKEFLQTLWKSNERNRLELIQGLGWKRDNVPVINPPRPYIKDIDTILPPSRHLINMSKYRPGPQHFKLLPMTTMITSRGCPFSCTFCDSVVIWDRKYRLRSISNVFAEIHHLIEKYGIRDICFWDDLWGVNKKWANEFCDRLLRENLNISWSCECRVDTVTPELLKKMASAGCWCVFYGFESLDQDVLNVINKKTSPLKIRDAIKWTKDAGMEIRANFILGLPNETPDKVRKMLEDIQELELDYVKFNIITPYPGTELYNQIKSGKWGKMSTSFDRLTGYFATFLPEGYGSLEEIEKLRRFVHRRYYFRIRYILSRLKRIRGWKDILKYYYGMRALLKI